MLYVSRFRDLFALLGVETSRSTGSSELIESAKRLIGRYSSLDDSPEEECLYVTNMSDEECNPIIH